MIELSDEQKPHEGLEFNVSHLDENTDTIIKVIGVGGGGGNAVNHMYRQGIHNVNFVVCNTDKKALQDSPVPYKLQLGQGLGAGNKPEVARQAAEEAIAGIRQMLEDGTKMVFITAGMGGGTGTGAAPIVAREAKALGILTVGIVTIPFKFEGIRKIDQALSGVEEIAKHVDALLVINNERLREIYPDLTVIDAFAKADDTLNVAAKGIAEIISVHGKVGLDFNDVCTALKDGGVAIMSTGYGEGDNRLSTAIDEALNSPLLNNNDIFNSKKILISFIDCLKEDGGSPLKMEEITEMSEFMKKFDQEKLELKWGMSHDATLGQRIKITILATGFGMDDIPGMYDKHQKEEQTRQEQSAEEHERIIARRNKYYREGDDKDFVKKRFQVFLFQEEDLDNADIIAYVDASPTYKRTQNVLHSIRNKSYHQETAPSEKSEEKTVPPRISF